MAHLIEWNHGEKKRKTSGIDHYVMHKMHALYQKKVARFKDV